MNDKEKKPLSTPSDLGDINRVMDAHSKEWMAIPGVVGCYVTLSKDGNPCIRIMVIKKTPELEKKLPPSIEGHSIEIEESEEIKPLTRHA